MGCDGRASVVVADGLCVAVGLARPCRGLDGGHGGGRREEVAKGGGITDGEVQSRHALADRNDQRVHNGSDRILKTLRHG